MRNHRCLAGCVCGLCLAAALYVEGTHLSHAAAVCLERSTEPDLGPPEGCNERGQPHPRNFSINNLASASSVSVTVTSPSFVVFDPDDVRRDLQLPFTIEESGSAPQTIVSYFDAALVRKIIDGK